MNTCSVPNIDVRYEKIEDDKNDMAFLQQMSTFESKSYVASPAGPSVDIMFHSLKSSFKLHVVTSSHGTREIEGAVALSVETMCLRRALCCVAKPADSRNMLGDLWRPGRTIKLKYPRARKIKRPKPQAK